MEKNDTYFFLSVDSSFLTDYYTLYPGSYLENEGNHLTIYIYIKKILFKKRLYLLYFRWFWKRKQCFYYILRRANPINGFTFCLDKCLLCYIDADRFVSCRCLFIVSTCKFYLNLELMLWIHNPNLDSKF